MSYVFWRAKRNNLPAFVATSQPNEPNQVKINSNNSNHLIGTDGDDIFDADYYASYAHYFNLNLLNHFLAGDGNDLMGGSNRDDHLWGGTGHDELLGYAGNDYIYGEQGDDKIFADVGGDTVHGGSGDDIIVGFTASNDKKASKAFTTFTIAQDLKAA